MNDEGILTTLSDFLSRDTIGAIYSTTATRYEKTSETIRTGEWNRFEYLPGINRFTFGREILGQWRPELGFKRDNLVCLSRIDGFSFGRETMGH